MRRHLAVTCVVAAVCVLGTTGRASAQDDDTVSMIRDTGVHRRSVDLSILAGAPGFGLSGYGGGVRIAFPLLHDGFLPTVNDGVFLETGAEFIRWTYLTETYSSITIPLHMRWNFYLARDWTAFVSAGFEGSYFLGEDFFDGPPGVPFFNMVQGGVLTFGVGGGVLYNFNEATSLRLDASLSLLGIGLTFRF